jgi:CheY-like chemotaxis protein
MSDPYPNYIREAFIDPIRTVLIVDDDYPTIQDLLIGTEEDHKEERERAERKNWHKSKESVQQVVQQFRGGDTPFLLDVHDGYNVAVDEEENNVAHLHQTDLLILDYQLDGKDNGEKALTIAQGLLENAHFNLVIVHSAKPKTEVFNTFLKNFLSPSREWPRDENKYLAQLAAHTPGATGKEDLDIHALLAEQIGLSHYFDTRRDPTQLRSKLMRRHGIWGPVTAILNDSAFPVAGYENLVNDYLQTFEQSIAAELSATAPGGLSWGSPNDTETPWIRTERAFFSFMEKGESELIQYLEQSLNDWAPRPSRLVLTKLRAEIDERGIEAQDTALDDPFAASLWYNELLRGSESQRKQLSSDLVRRHTDQLLDQILPEVNEFVGRLAASEDVAGDAEIVAKVKKRYGIKLTANENAARARAEHNAIVCSKNPTGWHLDIGHIFTLGDSNSEKAFWLCLTPACDLVPGQKSPGIFRVPEKTNLTRFNAVRLHKRKLITANENANTNRYLFVKIDNSISAFEFSESFNASPQWDTMFAELDQSFESSREFTLRRLEYGPRGGGPTLETTNAKVVAQLRYEYAIHYNSLLGGTLSRVGLDFRETPTQED